MPPFRPTLLLASLAALLAAPASAQHVWTGAGGTNWATASSWSPATVPTLSDAVTIGPAASQPTVSGTQACASLTVLEGATLTLSGDLDVGSTGAPGPLDLQWSGDALQTTGQIVFASSSSDLRLTGAWSQDHPDALVSTTGWVELFGVSVVGPAAPTVGQVRLVSGGTTLGVDLVVTTELESTGGTTSGAGAVRFAGTPNKFLDSRGNAIHTVELAEGLLTTVAFNDGGTNRPSTVGTFAVDGGELRGENGAVTGQPSLEVTALLSLTSGALGARDGGTAIAVLGDVSLTGPIGNPASASYDDGGLSVQGSWTGAVPYTGPVWIELLDGSQVTGADPGFAKARLATGVTSLSADTQITGELESTGGFSMGSGRFRFTGPLNKTLDSRGKLVHAIELVEGRVTAVAFNDGGVNRASTVGTLELDGGELWAEAGVVSGQPGLEVTTLLDLRSGRLGVRDGSFLEATGDVQLSGALGNPTSSIYDGGSLRFGGTWTGSVLFDVGQIWIEPQGGAQIAGPNPGFDQLRLTAGLVDVTVDTDLGDEVESTGGGTTGSGALVLTGPSITTLDTRGNVVERVRVDGGEARPQFDGTSGQPSRVRHLELASGRVSVQDGQVGLEVLDTVVVSGPMMDPTSSVYDAGTIRSLGTWTGSETFDPGQLWVELPGGAQIGGSAPGFGNLRLTGGTVVVGTDTAITVELESTGGTSTGPGAFRFETPVNKTLDTRGNAIHAVDVADGPVTAVAIDDGGQNQPSTVANLTVDGGELRGAAGTVAGEPGLVVTGLLDLRSGAFGVQDSGFLDVTGDVACDGLLGNPSSSSYDGGTLRFDGTWSGTAAFDVGQLWVEPRGGAQIAGAAPGFARLRLTGGDVAVTDDTTITTRLESTGGTTSGSGAFVFVGPGSATLRTDGFILERVRLEGGSMLTEIAGAGLPTRVRNLELQGGALGLQNGTVAMEVLERVDVTGPIGNAPSFYTSGTLRALGTWEGSTTLNVSSQWVELADGATVQGSAPGIGRLRLTDGTVELAEDVAIVNALESTGGESSGTGAFVYTGPTSATLQTDGYVLERVRLEGGSMLTQVSGASLPSRVRNLELQGGVLGLQNGTTALEVLDRVEVTGQIGNAPSFYTTGILRVLGTWDGSTTLDVSNQWVELAGGAVVEGTAPGFSRLRLTDGTVDLASDVAIVDSLLSTGGESTGTGAFVFADSPSATLQADGFVLERVRLTGGTLLAQVSGASLPARVRNLELQGGSLGLQNGTTPLEVIDRVEVTGSIGAAPSFYTNGILRVLGTWDGSTTFDVSSHQVELADGAVVEGSAPGFGRLRVVGLGNEIRSSTVVEDLLDLTADSELRVVGANLDVELANWFENEGLLWVGPGAALRRPDNSTTDLEAGSTLTLAGTPVAPARIGALGTPGADFEVRGVFNAVNFEVSGLSSAGLELDSTATIGTDGFRDGTFDSGEGGAGSRLLTANATAPFTASNVAFENTSGLTESNVFRNSTNEITFLNWAGTLGGPDFEDDPGTSPPIDPDGYIAWIDSSAPDLRPLAISGPQKAVGDDVIQIDWTVLNQGGGDALAPWSERLVLSSDTLIDAGDIELATVAAPGDLLQSVQAARSTSVTVPTGLDGEYYLGVIVDVSDQVTETGSEENNTGYMLTPVTVTPEPRPDVVAEAIAVPVSAEEGESMSVTWTVVNDGTGEAQPVASGGGVTPPWEDALYLSLDPTFSAGDAFLGSFPAPVSTLEVDGTYQNTQSVVLPDGISGQRYVVVRVDAQNGIPEGLQEANNIAASAALTVEQFDLPDLVATGIGLTADFGTYYTGTEATAVVDVLNQDPDLSGKGTANGLWYDRLWLSSDASLGGDTLLASTGFSGVLAPDEGYTVERTFNLPSVAQTWYLIAELDRTDALNETDDGNNLLVQPFDVVDATYSATVATVLEEGLSADGPGEVLVTLTGQAIDGVSGAPLPNAEVTIRVRHKGTRRVYPVLTDGSGDYSFVFEPLIGEAGLFDLYADHPAVVEDPVEDLQDSFELFDLTVSPGNVVAQLDVGETVQGSVLVRNPGDTQVDGITIATVGLPAHLTLTDGGLPTSLAPFAQATLDYELSAVGEAPDPATPANVALELSVDVAGSPAVAGDLALTTFVSPLTVDLVADLNELDGTFPVLVPAGKFSTYQLAVTNQGGATATNLSYAVPCEATPGYLDPESSGCGFVFVPVTPTDLGDLAPGATVVVEVGFVPAASLAIGTQIQSTPGSEIVVTSDQGAVSFAYDLVLDTSATGDVVVTVVDELAYWDLNGNLLSPPVPGLAGAAVELQRFNDPNTFYTGTSDTLGQVELFDAFGSSVGTQVQAGTYTVDITAPDHSGYSAVIQVGGGQTVDLLAFLAIQAVTYSFDVVPTEQEDVYDITLEADFNVIVPVPKIIVDPQFIPLDLVPGEVRQIDLSITNDGLITAFGMELFMDDLLPGYTVDPLITDIGDLTGGATIVVPVTVTRSSSASELACGYGQTWGLRHYLVAPDFLKWYWTPIWYSAPVGECPPGISPTQPPPTLPPPVNPPPGSGGGGTPPPGSGSGGSGGGGSPGTPAVTPPPPIDIPSGCEDT